MGRFWCTNHRCNDANSSHRGDFFCVRRHQVPTHHSLPFRKPL
ncbi:unnamed protein product [Spirodela intermedia]|uniref:Uncharacterized protein n=1 Tax=Spirodela intermedia TaxID=51605 RepID=A0A7I8L084_SPIIN|nr:unnamed protein product [Spirodela intermedia]